MNIIELAKEAGLPCQHPDWTEGYERFAAIVRAEREWVDLTNDEIQKACDETIGKINDSLELYWYRIGVAYAVIAKFKEKNK